MAGATILVAAVLSVLNIRTTNTAIDNGIRDLAEATTASAAAANGAALRFGNAAALEEALARVLETSDGAALRAIAVNAQGETLVDLGSAGAGAVRAGRLARPPHCVGRGAGFARRVPARRSQFRGLRHGERGRRRRHRLDTRPQPRRRAVPTDHQPRDFRRRAVRPALWRRTASAHARVQTRRVLAEEIVTLSDGRYDTEVPFTDRGDEIGTIARNLSDLQSQLAEAARGVEARARIEAGAETVVERLAVRLQTVAGGDLDPEDRHARSTPNTNRLRESFNETVDTFVRVIEQMARNADTIRSSAESIALSSDDLSARTENQAASLEETAAALNMITSNVETRPSAPRTWSASSSTRASAPESASRAEDRRCDVADRGLVAADLPHHLRHRRDRVPDEPAGAQRGRRGGARRRGRTRLLGRRQRGAGAGPEVLGRRQRDQGSDQRQFGLRGTGRGPRGQRRQRAEVDHRKRLHDFGPCRRHLLSAREQSASLAEVNTGVAQLDRVTQQNAAMVSQANDAGRTLRDEANAMARSIAVFKLPDGAG
jgi:methyl-accepting chemotaxis protein